MDTNTVVKRVGVAFVLGMIAILTLVMGIGLYLSARGLPGKLISWWILEAGGLAMAVLAVVLARGAYLAFKGRSLIRRD